MTEQRKRFRWERSRLGGVLLAAVAVSLVVSPALGGNSDKKAAALRDEIAGRIAKYQENPNNVCGIYVTDLRISSPLIDINSERTYMTASNMKLLTGSFALEKLGHNFAFTTDVYQLGDDIVVVGDGDPTIGCADLSKKAGVSVYAELDRWAAAIKKKAGAKFTGDLLLCSRFKIKTTRHPAVRKKYWHWWYQAPVGGLNFHDNNYNVNVTVADGKVTPTLQPSSRFIKVVNELKRGKKKAWTLQTSEDESVVTLRGTAEMSSASPTILSINQPALFLGRVLADRIVRAGVPFDGKIRTVPHDFDVSGGTLLHRKKTPLADSLKRMNKRSLNMAAQCHFLRAGDGTWEGSPKLMTDVILKTYELSEKGFTVHEGSGLSGQSRAAPRELVRLLTKILARKDGSLLVESLPISGVDGTLEEQDRFQEKEYHRRVLGKTGTGGSASCVTGFILDKQSKPVLVFSIMANRLDWTKENFARPAREFKDPIIKILVDYVDGK